MKEFMSTWGLVLLSAFFDSYAAFIVKSRFNELGKMSFDSFSSVFGYLSKFIYDPFLFSAMVAFVLAPGFWFIALNRLDLSVAYPILVGIHLLLVFILGVWFLGESITLNKIIGTILILSSTYFFFK